jgi:hypothetical protein
MTLQELMHQNMITSLVQRNILCPVTREVLDVRTCVVLLDRDGDPTAVLSQRGHRETPAQVLADLDLTVDESTVRS